jgi:hypothetical protein
MGRQKLSQGARPMAAEGVLVKWFSNQTSGVGQIRPRQEFRKFSSRREAAKFVMEELEESRRHAARMFFEEATVGLK